MYDIIFVCTGNTCRSPMAEAIAASLKPEANFTSMGVAAHEGSPASPNACLAMEKEGLTLEGHTSKTITANHLKNAKLILTMTQNHLSYVKNIYPNANAYTLAGYAGKEKDISDPFGGGLETYMRCAKEIKALIEVCLFERI